LKEGEKRHACWFLVGEPEGRRPLGRPKIDLKKKYERVWTGFIWLKIRTSSKLL
jgi:hypothetical protein